MLVFEALDTAVTVCIEAQKRACTEPQRSLMALLALPTQKIRYSTPQDTAFRAVALTTWLMGSVLVSDTNCMTKGDAGDACSCSGVPACSVRPRLNTTTSSAMSNASSCAVWEACAHV